MADITSKFIIIKLIFLWLYKNFTILLTIVVIHVWNSIPKSEIKVPSHLGEYA